MPHKTVVNLNEPLIPGWYGKIPSLGDFVSRRLPADFIVLWDNWLQQAIASSQTKLGESWVGHYLVSPIWRFILMPEICRDSMWIGILMPSIDKIGRHFPLTFAIEVDPQPATLFTALSAQSWYLSLEQLALNTLNLTVTPDDIDQALLDHAFPSMRRMDKDYSVINFADWWKSSSLNEPEDYHTSILSDPNLLLKQFELTAENIFFKKGQEKSIWWNVSEQTTDQQIMTKLHCFVGLPKVDLFTMFLVENKL